MVSIFAKEEAPANLLDIPVSLDCLLVFLLSFLFLFSGLA